MLTITEFFRRIHFSTTVLVACSFSLSLSATFQSNLFGRRVVRVQFNNNNGRNHDGNN